MEHAVHCPTALFVSLVVVVGALGPAHVDELPFELALLRDRVVLGQVLGTVSAIFGLIDEPKFSNAIPDAPMHLRINNTVCACIRSHQLLCNEDAGGDRPHVGPNAIKNPPAI